MLHRTLSLSLLALTACLAACASSSPMRGYALNLQVNDPTKSRMAIYDISSAGLFTYRAGRDAAAGDARQHTWQGTVTAEDAAPLVALLEANPNYSPNRDAAAPQVPVFRLTVFSATLGLPDTMTSDGPTPFLTALWNELDALQRRKRPEVFSRP